MGATVIKTEPLHGDAQRTQGPGFGCEKNDYEDPTFDLNNTNKDLVAINLKDEDGMKFMKKLLADADVFVVNLRDKALKKLGLDWETIHAEFPHLIWAQMRGYGEFGPEKDSPGYDAVCWAARGGVANVFREKDQSPAIAPQAFGDNNAACMLAGGICAALFNRTRTGVGDKVVTNLYAAAISHPTSVFALSSSALTILSLAPTFLTPSTTPIAPLTTSGSTSACLSTTSTTQ